MIFYVPYILISFGVLGILIQFGYSVWQLHKELKEKEGKDEEKKLREIGYIVYDLQGEDVVSQNRKALRLNNLP